MGTGLYTTQLAVGLRESDFECRSKSHCVCFSPFRVGSTAFSWLLPTDLVVAPALHVAQLGSYVHCGTIVKGRVGIEPTTTGSKDRPLGPLGHLPKFLTKYPVEESNPYLVGRNHALYPLS